MAQRPVFPRPGILDQLPRFLLQYARLVAALIGLVQEYLETVTVLALQRSALQEEDARWDQYLLLAQRRRQQSNLPRVRPLLPGHLECREFHRQPVELMIRRMEAEVDDPADLVPSESGV